MADSSLIKKNNGQQEDESMLEVMMIKVKNISFQVLSVLLKNEEEDIPVSKTQTIYPKADQICPKMPTLAEATF